MRQTESTTASLLQESVARFMHENCEFYSRRRREGAAGSDLHGLWIGLAELGALGLHVPEAFGGLGVGYCEAFVVCREFGRVALSTPYVATALLAPAALEFAGSELQAELYPRIIGGDARIAVAVSDFGVLDVTGRPGIRAESRGTDVRLDGELSMLLHGQDCDEALLRVRLNGATEPTHVAFVPGAQISSGQRQRLFDGTPVTQATFNDVLIPAHRLVPLKADEQERLRIVFALGCASEASGLVDALISMTADYLRVREAFGQTLDRFQALQHRMTDLRMSQEAVRSAVALLIHALRPSSAAHRMQLVHGALASLGGHVRRVGKEAIQLHGAVGAMWDHFAGAGLPRLVALQHICGDSAHHLQAYADILCHERPDGRYRPII